MSLCQYCQENPGEVPTWPELEGWYESSAHWEWIRRNVDRECARSDIQPEVWKLFLQRLAKLPDKANPCGKVDAVIQSDPQAFFLPGKALPRGGTALHRYIPLDHFIQYDLRVAPSGDSERWAPWIGTLITGEDLEGTSLGQDGYPVWCTDDTLAQERSADVIRNRLGLRTSAGLLVEIAYPESLLADQDLYLHAPTFLDASARGAERGVCCKRQGTGDEDWGWTVEVTRDGRVCRGVREAVHAALPILSGKGRHVGLRVIMGPLSLPPRLDFRRLLGQSFA